VLIELEPDRIRFSGRDFHELDKRTRIERFVAEGLRAQLKSGSLITGHLYVDLDFHEDAPPAEVWQRGEYPVIPTVTAAPLDEITNKAGEFLDTLNALPLEEIGVDLRDTVKGTKDIVASAELTRAIAELELALKQFRATARGVDQDVLPKLSGVLEQARVTLKSADSVVAQDSVLYLEIKRALRELSAAARSIRGMADYLERHPEALIKGKGR
jgi:paraquat-inducible protein B